MSDKMQPDNAGSFNIPAEAEHAGEPSDREASLSLEEETLGEGDCTLEQSFELYKEGMTLLKDGNARIDRVEKKMLEISKEGELHEFSGGTK